MSPSSPLLLSHPLLLLWDHGNCASSVAFPALPAALREEACSNDLLLSSLAIIALTINSCLAFLRGGGGGGGMRVWAPSLELLVMCLAAVPILPLLPFHCCYHPRETGGGVDARGARREHAGRNKGPPRGFMPPTARDPHAAVDLQTEGALSHPSSHLPTLEKIHRDGITLLVTRSSSTKAGVTSISSPEH
ncbi:hypothetical protein F7725_005918 [Dissostichus mawsoni]|uniref:Uncharacterized protein n=1 Tax=Dissostichus mawsoni TaxID=36200 RepID=A0A7J5YTS9_DISMA|nr:hypothetical protein F7725_005918 [Dissostichus mawsoni]